MPATATTAQRIGRQRTVMPVAYTLKPAPQFTAQHWRLNYPPTHDMALTLQRGQMLSNLESYAGEDPSYRHYYQVSQKSLAEQFRHWVESQAFDQHWDKASEDLLWANSRLLARRGFAASRDLIEHNGQPSQQVHQQLLALYTEVQYPCLARVQRQQKIDYAATFNPMHHGWALRRTLRDLSNIGPTQEPAEACMQPVSPLSETTAVSLLKDLFGWYYGADRQCLHTNLMPQRSWSRFCRKTEILAGIEVAELYAAAKYLVERVNIQHGVDFSEQHDVFLLRIALLQTAQWWLLSETGRLG